MALVICRVFLTLRMRRRMSKTFAIFYPRAPQRFAASPSSTPSRFALWGPRLNALLALSRRSLRVSPLFYLRLRRRDCLMVGNKVLLEFCKRVLDLILQVVVELLLFDDLLED